MSDKPDHESARRHAENIIRDKSANRTDRNLARCYLDFADSPDHAPAPPARPLPEEGDEAWAKDYASRRIGDPYCKACTHEDLMRAIAHGRRQGEAERAELKEALVEARAERDTALDHHRVVANDRAEIADELEIAQDRIVSLERERDRLRDALRDLCLNEAHDGYCNRCGMGWDPPSSTDEHHEDWCPVPWAAEMLGVDPDKTEHWPMLAKHPQADAPPWARAPSMNETRAMLDYIEHLERIIDGDADATTRLVLADPTARAAYEANERQTSGNAGEGEASRAPTRSAPRPDPGGEPSPAEPTYLLPEGWGWERDVLGGGREQWEVAVGPSDEAVWTQDGTVMATGPSAEEVPIPVVLAVLHRAGLLPSGLTPDQRRDLAGIERLLSGLGEPGLLPGGIPMRTRVNVARKRLAAILAALGEPEEPTE